jgi:hypothetical protein
LSPPDGEIVESIVLDGHRLGYGAILGYYGLHDGRMFGGAVLGYKDGETVVAQHWGGEVCIAYEYMERTRITEPYYGTCCETYVQIDGKNEFIFRRAGTDPYSKGWVSMKVEARTSRVVPSGAEDDGSDGSSGRIPSLPPLLIVALVFNAFIFSIISAKTARASSRSRSCGCE